MYQHDASYNDIVLVVLKQQDKQELETKYSILEFYVCTSNQCFIVHNYIQAMCVRMCVHTCMIPSHHGDIDPMQTFLPSKVFHLICTSTLNWFTTNDSSPLSSISIITHNCS